ncbi:hypothetical protein [Pyxidicoccus trucidator]|uniref:hypothetical protein n=1 Tax=Pyxidicoccus trucidator TaxID=2709662 RepID=UPI0013DB8301|nr:hypothetical protein [Pyxidicoccus trucidator]
MIRARDARALAAALLGLSGVACSEPDPGPGPGPGTPEKKVHTQAERTLACDGHELRIPALDESMTLAWASFQVAQQNQEALASLGAEARKSLFDACVIPAIVGTK